VRDVFGPQSQAGAAFAALVVTWVAIVLLVLVVAHLHARLRRLEQADRASQEDGPHGGGLREPPYAGLLGRSLADLVGVSPAPRVLLVLTASCTSCRRLLADLTDPSWSVPTALAWADGTPGGDLPVPVLPDGPRVAGALGVRVTPFGVVSDDGGDVIWAGPVTSLKTLADRVRPARDRITATGQRQP
jgi:hypothetical protein